MAIEGSLETFQLPEILQMISAQRKTGILTVQGEADIVAISFKDGHVVAADALNQTVEEGLGQILASQGLVSPRDFAAVSAEHDGGGKGLLHLLLGGRPRRARPAARSAAAADLPPAVAAAALGAGRLQVLLRRRGGVRGGLLRHL